MVRRAVIDRFNGDMAVLVFLDNEEIYVLTRAFLPEGAEEGSKIRIEFEDDWILTIELEQPGYH